MGSDMSMSARESSGKIGDKSQDCVRYGKSDETLGPLRCSKEKSGNNATKILTYTYIHVYVKNKRQGRTQTMDGRKALTKPTSFSCFIGERGGAFRKSRT